MSTPACCGKAHGGHLDTALIIGVVKSVKPSGVFLTRRTGIFISQEELDALRLIDRAYGAWLERVNKHFFEGGTRDQLKESMAIIHPQEEIDRLAQKYQLQAGCSIGAQTGEFQFRTKEEIVGGRIPLDPHNPDYDTVECGSCGWDFAIEKRTPPRDLLVCPQCHMATAPVNRRPGIQIVENRSDWRQFVFFVGLLTIGIGAVYLVCVLIAWLSSRG